MILRRVAFAVLLLGGGIGGARAAEPPVFAGGETGAVRAVIDGRTLTLADGRQVTLVGIDVPIAGRRGAADLAERATAALKDILGSGGIELRFSGAEQDRYGHVLAQVFAAGHWAQGEMLKRGLARVHGRADDRIGLPAMLAIEEEARQARRGIWARPFYAVRQADALGRDWGQFQIVEGTVAQAAAVAGGVYVNFGADWRTAFSLHIDGAALKLCRAAGLDPLRLDGAKLRVRGFVAGGRRPLMEITFPEQIERLD